MIFVADFGHDLGMNTPRRFLDLYRFPGFQPLDRLETDDKLPDGVLVTLQRLPQKDTVEPAGSSRDSTTTPAIGRSAISRAAIVRSRSKCRSIASSVIGAAA